MLDAPWALRTAVPRRPIILGKKLGRGGGLKYHRGDDYFEVDFELARSPFMERVYRSLKWASPCAEEEIVFMLEGQAEDELPECVLGAVRLKRVGESSFRKLPPMAVGAGKKSLHFDRFNFARDDPARQDATRRDATRRDATFFCEKVNYETHTTPRPTSQRDARQNTACPSLTHTRPLASLVMRT